MNAARRFAGEPRKVVAMGSRDGAGVPALMLCDGDVLAQFDAGMNLPGRDRLELVGSDASLHLADPWRCREPYFEIRGSGPPGQCGAWRGRPSRGRPRRKAGVRFDLSDSYRLEFEAFTEQARTPRSSGLYRADCIGEAATLDALHRSLRSATLEDVGGASCGEDET